MIALVRTTPAAACPHCGGAGHVPPVLLELAQHLTSEAGLAGSGLADDEVRRAPLGDRSAAVLEQLVPAGERPRTGEQIGGHRHGG